MTDDRVTSTAVNLDGGTKSLEITYNKTDCEIIITDKKKRIQSGGEN